MRSALPRGFRAATSNLLGICACALFSCGIASAQSRPEQTARPVARLVSAYGSSDAASTIPVRALSRPVATAGATIASGDERRIFELINSARAAQGLAPLRFDPELCRVARRHSGEMAAGDFLNHTNGAGQDAAARAREEGIGWRALGENIARNQGFDDPAAFAVERWMQSAKHRANITNPTFTHTGLGVAQAADGTFYFTQVFVMR